MSKLKMKAKAGVTLVELLVVILIITILSVSLLPLLKPYIEQAKYAAEVQPALAKIQTTINLYQYEKDRLPSGKYTPDSTTGKTVESSTDYDTTEWGWTVDSGTVTDGKFRKYKEAIYNNGEPTEITDFSNGENGRHISKCVDVTWQDLIGRRLNPSQFRYHVIKGLGAARYGYAIGVFGDGDGLAKGTGYAILVLVDTENKQKLIATWERYSPKSDETVEFWPSEVAPDMDTDGSTDKNKCIIPTEAQINVAEGTQIAKDTWKSILGALKEGGWSFNFDDVVD